MWTHDLILQTLDSLHTGSISFTSSPYQTNDHMNKAKHKAMNCETNMCTHIVLKPDHAFAALCHNFWLTRKGCASFFLYSPPGFLYTIPPKPITLLQSPFSPWLCCPTDHAVTLSLANTSLITRLIIFFSCSYFLLSSFTLTPENWFSSYGNYILIWFINKHVRSYLTINF